MTDAHDWKPVAVDTRGEIYQCARCGQSFVTLIIGIDVLTVCEPSVSCAANASGNSP